MFVGLFVFVFVLGQGTSSQGVVLLGFTQDFTYHRLWRGVSGMEMTADSEGKHLNSQTLALVRSPLPAEARGRWPALL